MARKTPGIPVKTAKVRITAFAATKGWTVRDDGGPGKITDYFKSTSTGGTVFIRVRYDRFGRIVSVQDAYGTRLVHGGGRAAKVIYLLGGEKPTG